MTTASIDVARIAEIDRLAKRELADTGLPGLAIGLTGLDGPPEVRTSGGPSRPVSPMARPGRPVSASSRFARRSISAMRATSIEAVVMRGILAVGTCRRPPASPAVPPVAPPRNPGIRTPFVLREV